MFQTTWLFCKHTSCKKEGTFQLLELSLFPDGNSPILIWFYAWSLMCSPHFFPSCNLLPRHALQLILFMYMPLHGAQVLCLPATLSRILGCSGSFPFRSNYFTRVLSGSLSILLCSFFLFNFIFLILSGAHWSKEHILFCLVSNF